MAPVSEPVLLERHWQCPHRHCSSWATTRDDKVPMHNCAQTRGLLVPLVPVGQRGEHRVVERGDWVGNEQVQLDPEKQRPVMSVVTVTDRGQDCTVYAPTASISAQALRR